jgi:hypothetical protein
MTPDIGLAKLVPGARVALAGTPLRSPERVALRFEGRRSGGRARG